MNISDQCEFNPKLNPQEGCLSEGYVNFDPDSITLRKFILNFLAAIEVSEDITYGARRAT